VPPEPDQAVLLAGLIDLPHRNLPHPPGTCGALCTPQCAVPAGTTCSAEPGSRDASTTAATAGGSVMAR
jgi:hypothetical protein